MKASNSVEIIRRNDKVLLANRKSGKWIRLSNEVYEIINEIVEQGHKIDEVEKLFECKDDYKFIKEIYDSIMSNILCPHEMREKKIASIALTNRCNLHCSHCCTDAKQSTDIELDISTEDMLKIFDRVIAWNPRNIMLSGGEPMIRPDFMFLLNYLREKFSGNIILSTNATFIDIKNVNILIQQCNSFEISIDGVDEESCSHVRGPGVFGIVYDAVKLLKQQGADRINLSMVFSDKAEHLLGRFETLNEELGTYPVTRLFSPTGRGKENRFLFSNKKGSEVFIPSAYLSDDFSDAFGVCTCKAGKEEIFIDSDGTLYPCIDFTNEACRLGNVLDCSHIEDLIPSTTNHPFCEQILLNHPICSDKCKNCDITWFCWTCPGEALDYDSEEAFENRCSLLKPILMKRVWESQVNI